MTPIQVRTLWLTAPLVLGVVVYLIALDFVLYARHGSEATISATYGKLLWEWPGLSWLAGLVTGILAAHFLWGRDWREVGREPEPGSEGLARRETEGSDDAAS